MFDHQHYVPILKGKEGEYTGLQVLAASSKAGLTPLIEVPNVPWDYVNKCPKKSLDEHLSTAARKMATAWGTQRPTFVDLCWIPGTSATTSTGQHALEYLSEKARAARLSLIPVTGVNRDADYQDAVQLAVKQQNQGLCVRIERDDFEDISALKKQISTLVRTFELAPGDVDLIVDLKDMTPGQAPTLALAARDMIRALPNVAKWRTLTLAGSAFPLNMGSFKGSTISTTERTEWRLWRTLVGKYGKELPRTPSFSDYAISHPEPEEIDPRLMMMSANIRYTCDQYWLIVKGKAVRRNGFGQYRDLSKTLIARPEYSGSTFSWGDSFIDKCANDAEAKPGNATTWRKTGTSHHLTLVTKQIASLP